MTYAIIKSGGKQIKLNAGDNIWIEKINGEQGSQVNISEVLAVYDGSKLNVGKPMLSNAKVVANIVKQGKGPKITIVRFKNKSNWTRKQGHRQPYTKLFITEINLDGKTVAKASAPANVAKVE